MGHHGNVILEHQTTKKAGITNVRVSESFISQTIITFSSKLSKLTPFSYIPKHFYIYSW